MPIILNVRNPEPINIVTSPRRKSLNCAAVNMEKSLKYIPAVVILVRVQKMWKTGITKRASYLLRALFSQKICPMVHKTISDAKKYGPGPVNWFCPETVSEIITPKLFANSVVNEAMQAERPTYAKSIKYFRQYPFLLNFSFRVTKGACVPIFQSLFSSIIIQVINRAEITEIKKRNQINVVNLK